MYPRWLSWLGQLHDDYENGLGEIVRRRSGSWRVGRRYAKPLDRYLRSRGFRRLRSFAWRRGNEADGWVLVQLLEVGGPGRDPAQIAVFVHVWLPGAPRPDRFTEADWSWWPPDPSIRDRFSRSAAVPNPQYVVVGDDDRARVADRLLSLVRDDGLPWAERGLDEN